MIGCVKQPFFMSKKESQLCQSQVVEDDFLQANFTLSLFLVI